MVGLKKFSSKKRRERDERRFDCEDEQNTPSPSIIDRVYTLTPNDTICDCISTYRTLDLFALIRRVRVDVKPKSEFEVYSRRCSRRSNTTPTSETIRDNYNNKGEEGEQLKKHTLLRSVRLLHPNNRHWLVA